MHGHDSHECPAEVRWWFIGCRPFCGHRLGFLRRGLRTAKDSAESRPGLRWRGGRRGVVYANRIACGIRGPRYRRLDTPDEPAAHPPSRGPDSPGVSVRRSGRRSVPPHRNRSDQQDPLSFQTACPGIPSYPRLGGCQALQDIGAADLPEEGGAHQVLLTSGTPIALAPLTEAGGRINY